MATQEITMKAGLLMEAAQAHQQAAETALERLRSHTAGLDEVVRGEIRDTLLEELHALVDDVRGAQEALRALQRVAGLRLTFWSLGILSLASALPFALVYSVLPTAGQVAALSTRREELNEHIARLVQVGADVELRHCGVAQRLCVRIERSAPAYGEGRDFLVVKGH
jgi:hypothetical protein